MSKVCAGQGETLEILEYLKRLVPGQAVDKLDTFSFQL